MNWWYKLKCRFWHKYNRVVCRSLTPTWHDRDYLMLHCAFQILEDFIHIERGHFYDDVYELYLEQGEEYATQMKLDWDEIRWLYHWWQHRKLDVCDLDDYEKDTDMLHRLVALRKYLWT